MEYDKDTHGKIRRPIICWEKFKDPYDVTDVARESYIPHSLEDEDETTLGGLDLQQQAYLKSISPPMKVVMTPMGIVPVTEYSQPSKVFNFWTGHTNFDITNAVVKIIEKTRGVETLSIFTRYRCRVGVGKAFNDRDVLNSIATRVQALFQRSETASTGVYE
jgi:hypothetical protein